jgi:replicative DNA helicase
MSDVGLDKLINIDSERAVIGSCLIDPDAILQVADVLLADDFHDERWRHTYEAIYSLYEQQARIDYLTICTRLEDQGHLRAVGGAAALTGLVEATPTSLNVASYASIVHRLATLRRLVSTAGKIAALAYSAGGEQLDAVLTQAQRLIDAVTPEMSDDAVLLWLDSIERFVLWQLERNEKQADVEAGKLPSADFPWQALQRFRLKLRPGLLGIVAAGSSIGKTTFLECCAEYWARQGLSVAFFHCELSHQLMLERRGVRLSGVPLEEIERGVLDRRVQVVTEMMREYAGRVTYVHCPGWTAQRVAAKARQLAAKGLCDVGIVDYLQKLYLMRRRGQNKADDLGDAVEMLKVLAEQLGIPVLLASQFNRGSRGAARKTGDFIRGSGEPHEKANVVITLDREILDAPIYDEAGHKVAEIGQRSPVVQVRVDKNTLGPTGDTQLMMNPERFLILDVAQAGEGA